MSRCRKSKHTFTISFQEGRPDSLVLATTLALGVFEVVAFLGAAAFLVAAGLDLEAGFALEVEVGLA